LPFIGFINVKKFTGPAGAGVVYTYLERIAGLVGTYPKSQIIGNTAADVGGRYTASLGIAVNGGRGNLGNVTGGTFVLILVVVDVAGDIPIGNCGAAYGTPLGMVIGVVQACPGSIAPSAPGAVGRVGRVAGADRHLHLSISIKVFSPGDSVEGGGAGNIQLF